MDSYDQKGSKSKLIIVKKNRMTSHKPTYVHNRSSFFSKIFECFSTMFQLNVESHPSSSLLNPANAHVHGKEKMVEYLLEDSYSKSKNVSRNGYTYQLWKSNWTNQQVNLSTRSDELSFFWFLTVFFCFEIFQRNWYLRGRWFYHRFFASALQVHQQLYWGRWCSLCVPW